MTEDIGRMSFKNLPLSVTIETAGGIAVPLALRGFSLPLKQSPIFLTGADNQQIGLVQLLIGESPIAAHNKPISSFILHGIPKAKKGSSQIMMTIEINQQLDIIASAIELRSRAKVDVYVNVQAIALTDDEIQKLLIQYEASRVEDEKTFTSLFFGELAYQLFTFSKPRRTSMKGVFPLKLRGMDDILSAVLKLINEKRYSSPIMVTSNLLADIYTSYNCINPSRPRVQPLT